MRKNIFKNVFEEAYFLFLCGDFEESVIKLKEHLLSINEELLNPIKAKMVLESFDMLFEYFLCVKYDFKALFDLLTELSLKNDSLKKRIGNYLTGLKELDKISGKESIGEILEFLELKYSDVQQIELSDRIILIHLKSFLLKKYKNKEIKRNVAKVLFWIGYLDSMLFPDEQNISNNYYLLKCKKNYPTSNYGKRSIELLKKLTRAKKILL